MAGQSSEDCQTERKIPSEWKNRENGSAGNILQGQGSICIVSCSMFCSSIKLFISTSAPNFSWPLAWVEITWVPTDDISLSFKLRSRGRASNRQSCSHAPLEECPNGTDYELGSFMAYDDDNNSLVAPTLLVARTILN